MQRKGKGNELQQFSSVLSVGYQLVAEKFDASAEAELPELLNGVNTTHTRFALCLLLVCCCSCCCHWKKGMYSCRERWLVEPSQTAAVQLLFVVE